MHHCLKRFEKMKLSQKSHPGPQLYYIIKQLLTITPVIVQPLNPNASIQNCPKPFKPFLIPCTTKEHKTLVFNLPIFVLASLTRFILFSFVWCVNVRKNKNCQHHRCFYNIWLHRKYSFINAYNSLAANTIAGRETNTHLTIPPMLRHQSHSWKKRTCVEFCCAMRCGMLNTKNVYKLSFCDENIFVLRALYSTCTKITWIIGF